MKVSFELSSRDMRYFRDRLREVGAGKARDEDGIAKDAARMVAKAVATDPPEFVLERLKKLEQLSEILRDKEWRLEGRDRARIVDALAYFVDPDDVIPDRVPGLGYLDDAIMIELVAEELKHDIQAYDDFCAFRANGRMDPDRVASRRAGLQARMRRRSGRQRAEERSSGSRRSTRLW